MRNSRRRRNVLFLMVLTAIGGDARKKKQYAPLNGHGPFPLLSKVEAVVERIVPIKADREKELHLTRQVVNDFIPAGFLLLAPELKLWVAMQIVKRLLSTGWTPPREPEVLEFVQAMYNLADSLNLNPPPPQHLIDFVVKSPLVLRQRFGLFT
jgi:hypothetical protein